MVSDLSEYPERGLFFFSFGDLSIDASDPSLFLFFREGGGVRDLDRLSDNLLVVSTLSSKVSTTSFDLYKNDKFPPVSSWEPSQLLVSDVSIDSLHSLVGASALLSFSLASSQAEVTAACC